VRPDEGGMLDDDSEAIRINGATPSAHLFEKKGIVDGQFSSQEPVESDFILHQQLKKWLILK